MATFLADPLPGFDAATQALDSLVADDLQYLVSVPILCFSCGTRWIWGTGLKGDGDGGLFVVLTRSAALARLSRCASRWFTRVGSSRQKI
jgi:hypothetical protein